jgi:preprotein translocase subunit SecG
MNEVNESTNGSRARRFDDAGEALKEVEQAFDDWCSILTSHSLNATYAVIAANWAVHGNHQAILHNGWSKSSMTVALVFLGLNLLMTWWMSRLHDEQSSYAGRDPKRWEKEFKEKSEDPYWPYTKWITNVGRALRALKVWMPIIAALFLIISLFFGSPPPSVQ